MDEVVDLAGLNAVLGFISATFVLPVIQQPTWSDKTRAAVTFLYSIVLGVITAWFTTGFSGWHDVRVASAGVVVLLVSAIGTYNGFAKPTGIAPKLERATSGTRTRRY